MEILNFQFVPNDGSKIWPEITKSLIVRGIKIAILDKGMTSGLPSIMIMLGTESSGVPVVCETTARLFVSCARAIEAKYPDLFKDN